MSKYRKTCSFLFPFITAVFLFTIPLSATANTYSNPRQMRSQDLAHCRTTECILSYGLLPSHSRIENGKYVVIYTNPKKQTGAGYVTRQVGHGVMCLATLGMWEIAMDPIEKAAGNIILEATYPNKNTHFIEKIRIRGYY